MKNRMIVVAHSLLLIALLAAPSFAADPDEALKKADCKLAAHPNLYSLLKPS